MNQQELDRITTALKGLHLYALQVEPGPESLKVTIPDGKIYGFQLEQLMAIAKGYSLSIESTGCYLTCTMFW
ncbi:hypothetical protein [Spirosoma litoris]